MAKMTICRTDMEMPKEGVLEAVRSFLFGAVDGACKEDRRAWRHFWKRITRMEPGEMAAVEMVFPRNSKFHRKYFALLKVGFDAWEPSRKRMTYKGKPIAKNFDRFREEVQILAGFYVQTFDLKGRMRLESKSISFAKMDEQEFEHVYGAVADILLREVLINYAGREELDSVVNKIMEFNE